MWADSNNFRLLIMFIIFPSVSDQKVLFHKKRRDKIWKKKDDKSRFGYELHFREVYPFLHVQDLNG